MQVFKSHPVMFDIACIRPWLIASFARPQRVVSWSLNRPGFASVSRVAWLEVGNAELAGVEDPAAWFRQRLASASLEDSVGLITARNVSCYEFAAADVEGVRAECLITLGLNNGETVGSRVNPAAHTFNAGTINILAAVSVPLTDAALLELSSIATQARTAALLSFGYRRPGMTDVVTGTGTDCIVVASPSEGSALLHAGMHTAAGEAVGKAVREATLAAADAWLAARRLAGLEP
jgi:adenosylcobinamide amidohydrolase